MTKRTVLWVLGITLGSFLSGCFLFKVTSRRDKFVKQVIAPKTQPLAVVAGQPDGRAVPLGAGDVLVLAMDQPKYSGYSESLTLHVPKRWEHEGAYRVLLGDRVDGPWIPVGIGSSTKTFDISGTPFAISRYVKIEVLKSTRSKLMLDAVKLRVHTKTWRPPIHFKTTMTPPQAEKRFQELWQGGKKWFQKREYKAARIFLRGALKLRHKHAPTLYLLGATYYALEEHYQAIRFYRMAMQYGKPSREHLEEIASSYITLKSNDKAKRYVEQCMLIAPLYPACSYKRLHLASLEKNRKSLSFYKEMYRMVKKRTHIRSRKWTLQQFLSKNFSKTAPVITLYPQVFRCQQHLEWVHFLLRLFPKDHKAVMFFAQTGLDTRWQLSKTPTQKQECQYYRALFFHRFQQYKQSNAILIELESQEKRQSWLGKAYLLHGRNLEEAGQAKQAMAVYQRAHKRLASTPYGRPFFVKVMAKSLQSATKTSTPSPARRAAPTARRDVPAVRRKTPPVRRNPSATRNVPMRRTPPPTR